MYQTRIRIRYNHTRMVQINVPYAYGTAIHAICVHTANIIMVAVYGMNMQREQLELAAAVIAIHSYSLIMHSWPGVV